jgi:hypothetical protein
LETKISTPNTWNKKFSTPNPEQHNSVISTPTENSIISLANPEQQNFNPNLEQQNINPQTRTA